MKLPKKKNYVVKSLRRIEVMHGEEMTDYWQEGLCQNRFVTLTKGQDAMSMDELNELVSLGNK